MAHRAEPGLSVAIVHDQDLVWARGFGHADLENRVAATAGTRYRIASVTKLFTGTAILMHRPSATCCTPRDCRVRRRFPTGRTPTSPPVSRSGRRCHGRRPPTPSKPAGSTPISRSHWRARSSPRFPASPTRPSCSNASWTPSPSDTLVRAPHPDDPRLAVGYGRRRPSGRAVLSPSTDFRGITAAANDLHRGGPGEVRDVAIPGRAGRWRPGSARQHAAGDAARTLVGSDWTHMGPGLPCDPPARRYHASDTAVGRRGIARRCFSVPPTRPA